MKPAAQQAEIGVFRMSAMSVWAMLAAIFRYAFIGCCILIFRADDAT
jgi:hypothetical protein